MRRAIEQGRNVRMRPRQAHHRGPPTVGSLTCAPNGGINMIAHGPPVLRSGITPRLEIAGDESVSRRAAVRSEEHTSELQSLMRISYAVFCLKKKKMRPTQKQ